MTQSTIPAKGAEMEMLIKILADELILMLHTKNIRVHRSKKIFLDDQHKQLKEIIDGIVENLKNHKENAANSGNSLGILLSQHENIISYYREKITRVKGKSGKDISNFIESILQQHEKMAWAIREQLK